MTTRKVSTKSLFRHNAHQQIPMRCKLTGWPRAKQAPTQGAKQKTVGYDSLTQQTRQVAEMTKNTSRSQSDVIFVVVNALVCVLVNEVLAPHCHLNGDCQVFRSRASSGLFQSVDDCHSGRSRVSSELVQSADGCQRERSRVWPELHCYQNDGCHLASFHSSSPFLVFFLTSSILSSLAFHFSDVLERKFLNKFFTNGHEDRKMPEHICWSQPEVTVLELQDFPDWYLDEYKSVWYKGSWKYSHA